MVWHIICANSLPIVNIILVDGIKMFLNTLTKKEKLIAKQQYFL